MVKVELAGRLLLKSAFPSRKLRAMVDALLATMNCEFEAAYAQCGRHLVPPETLLKTLLLQNLFSLCSERQLDLPPVAVPIKSGSPKRYQERSAKSSSWNVISPCKPVLMR